MTGRRVGLVLGAAFLGCVLPAAATAADETPTPGPNDLTLQVQRLEKAAQTDAVGSSASAMLFAPQDTVSMVRARERAAAARAQATGALFGHAVPVWTPMRSDALFLTDDTASTGTRSTTTDVDVLPERGVPLWAPIALGLVLLGGTAATALIRDREVDADG